MDEIMSGLSDLTPKKIVENLDSYIIGQEKAKRAVAVALRNRERRLHLSEDIRDEVAPKNILMMGPTGVGKTEIARRLAKLVNAPFLKVEATKYTEVGYVGRDVESMVRDLMSVAFKDVKAEAEENLKKNCSQKVEERLLDLLLPGSEKKSKNDEEKKSSEDENAPLLIALTENLSGEKKSEINLDSQIFSEQKSNSSSNSTREKFRKMLREGLLDEREVELSIRAQNRFPSMEIIAGGSFDDLQNSVQNLASMFASGMHGKRKTVTVKEAKKILTEEILDSMVDFDKVSEEAKKRVEQSGIIFIDEIDKIAVKGESRGQDVSREGVQRDILPIVEGSSVSTRFGVVDTTHILFIAAGAFSVAAPSDLIPELQGRFPLRVELESLDKAAFKRILTEPKNSLVKQYGALLKTEAVNVVFGDDAIERMCEIAEDVNSRTENIGARRLHTVMEKVLEDVSFSADERKGETIKITPEYVDEKLKDVQRDSDLGRYIL